MDRHRRLILTTIVAVGAVVRFYRLDLTWFFLDHVRDVSTATAIAAGTSFPLLGPRVGWAEAYLGPLYFYLLAIPFSIARDPVVGAAFVALSHLLALLALYRFATEFFGNRVALYACGLFAVFPLTILSSRLVWHAGLLPPLVVFFMHALFRLIVKGRSTSVVLFVLLAVLTQLHLTAIALAGVALASVLVFRPRLRIWRVGAGVGSAVVLYLPYLVYEFAHRFENVRALTRVGASAMGFAGGAGVASGLENLLLLFSRPLSSFVVETQWSRAFLASFWILYGAEALLFGIGIVVCLYRLLGGRRAAGLDEVAARRQAALLLLWVVVPILIIRSRTTAIWWYYLDIVYPAPFLLAVIVLITAPSLLSWAGAAEKLTARALAGLAVAVVVSQVCFQVSFQRTLIGEGQMVVQVPRLAINGADSPFETLTTLPLGYRRDIIRAFVRDFGVAEDAFPRTVHGAVLGLVEENRSLVSYLSARHHQAGRAMDSSVHYLVARAVEDNSSLGTIRSERVGPYALFEYRPLIDYQNWSCAASARGPEGVSEWTKLQVPAADAALTTRGGERLFCRGWLQGPPAAKDIKITVSLVGWAPFDAVALRAGGRLLAPIVHESRQSPLMLRGAAGWLMGIGWASETVFDLTGAVESGQNPVTIELTGVGRIIGFDVYEGRSW